MQAIHLPLLLYCMPSWNRIRQWVLHWMQICNLCWCTHIDTLLSPVTCCMDRHFNKDSSSSPRLTVMTLFTTTWCNSVWKTTPIVHPSYAQYTSLFATIPHTCLQSHQMTLEWSCRLHYWFYYTFVLAYFYNASLLHISVTCSHTSHLSTKLTFMMILLLRVQCILNDLERNSLVLIVFRRYPRRVLLLTPHMNYWCHFRYSLAVLETLLTHARTPLHSCSRAHTPLSAWKGTW